MNNPATWGCFGKLWEHSRVECAGGFDLAYVDPITKKRQRRRCSAYDQCKAAKDRGVTYPQYQPFNVPTQRLTQATPPAPPVPPAIVPAAAAAPAWQPSPALQAARPLPAAAATNSHNAPWIAQQGPQAVPMPYQQPGAQMPAYLAVPEPLGEVWWLRLLAEVARSMAKAAGHSLASFFDHNPIRMHQAPQQPVHPAAQQQPPPPT